MLDRRRFQVPVSCPTCGHLVTISYLTPLDDAPITTFRWACPYEGCSGRGTFRLHGEFVGILAGLPRYGPKKNPE